MRGTFESGDLRGNRRQSEGEQRSAGAVDRGGRGSEVLAKKRLWWNVDALPVRGEMLASQALRELTTFRLTPGEAKRSSDRSVIAARPAFDGQTATTLIELLTERTN